MESEVFLAGHWKNFDELEESLSINELNALVKALREKEERSMKFHAAINGVDLEEKEPEDVAVLKSSSIASKEGFGVGEGLGFMSQE